MGGIFSALFQFFGFLIVFASILFLIVVTTRMIGNKARKSMKGKHINILESISIGFDKQIHLLKVTEKYFLIATFGKNIKFLSEIDVSSDYELPEQIESTGMKFDFKSLFEKYIKNNNVKDEEKNDKEVNAKTGTYGSDVFRKNLNKIRKIASDFKTKDKNNGDDEGNEKK